MNKWNHYFMSIAEESANLSKDPKTKVGAVIVHNKRIKSTGYNGAPSSFPDDQVPWNSSDDDELINQKNTYMVHAELNAILNYDGQMADLKDTTLYCTVSPCSRCACMIAQVGIKNVIYKEKYHRKNETDATDRIFKLSGVKCYSLDSEYNIRREVDDDNDYYHR